MKSSWQRSSKNKGKIASAAFLTLVVLLFLFRGQILVFATQCFLKTSFSRDLSYEKIAWDDDKVVISGFHLEKGGSTYLADRIELKLEGSLFPLYMEPHLTFLHPQITLQQKKMSGSSFPIGLLLPSKHYGVKLEMQNGVLELASQEKKERLYFIWKKEEPKEKLGSLLFSIDPSLFDHPIVKMDLQKKEKELSAKLHVEEISCAKLYPFISFFASSLQDGWKQLEGEIQIDSELAFSLPFTLEEINSKVKIKNLTLANSILGLEAKAKELQGDIFLPNAPEQALLERMLASFTIVDGECKLGSPFVSRPVALEKVQANFSLRPNVDPSLVLQADLVQDGKVSYVDLKGKGSFNEDQSYWTEAELEIRKEKQKTLAHLSLCSQEKGNFVFEADLKNLISDHIKIASDLACHFYPEMSRPEIFDGSLFAKTTLLGEKGKLKKVDIRDLFVKEMTLGFPEMQSMLYLKSLKAEASLVQAPKGWETSSLSLDLTQGGFQRKTKENTFVCTSLDGIFSMKENKIQPSFLNGEIDGIQARLDWQGPSQESDVKVSLFGPFKQFCQFLPKKIEKAPEGAVSMVAFLKKEKEQIVVTGSVQHTALHEESQNIEFGFDVENLPFLSNKKNEKIAISEGWFCSEKISSKLYGPLLQSFTKDLSLSGDLDLFGTFDQEGLEVSLQGEGLVLSHPYVVIEFPTLGTKDPLRIKKEGRAQFSYDAKKDHLKGKIPLHKAIVQEKKLGLLFTSVLGDILIDNRQLKFENFTADCEELKCKGSLYLLFGEGDYYDLKIVSKKIEGRLDGLKKYIKDMPSINGEVICKENGLVFSSRLTPEINETFCTIDGRVQKVNYSLNKACSLHNISSDVEFNSKDQRALLKNAIGELFVEGDRTYGVKINSLHFKNSPTLECGFDLQLSDAGREVIRMVGIGEEKEPSEIHFALQNSSSHLFGSKVELSSLILKDWGLKDAKGKVKINCLEVLPLLVFLDKTTLLPIGDSVIDYVQEKRLEGWIEASLSYQDALQKFFFSAEGRDLKENGSPLRTFILKGERSKGEWVIENFQLDQLQMKISLEPKESKWNISFFEMETPFCKAKGDGSYIPAKNQCIANLKSLKVDLSKIDKLATAPPKLLKGEALATGLFILSLPDKKKLWSLEGDLTLAMQLQAPVALSIKNDKKIKVQASKNSGLLCKDIHLISNDKSEIEFSELFFDLDKKKASLKHGKGSISPELLGLLLDAKVLPLFLKDAKKEPLQFSLECDLLPQFALRGTLLDGKYHLYDKDWDLSQLALNYESSIFTLSGKTQIQKSPLFFGVKLDLTSDLLGMIKLHESQKKEGLKALFYSRNKEPVKWESIQGSLYGFDVNLSKTKSPNMLSGSVKIDGEKVVSLFSEELKEKITKYKIGKGYELQGNFLFENSVRFSGSLIGSEFEIFGNRIQSLQAEAEIRPNVISLKNVTAEDQAGQISIKLIKAHKQGDLWELDVPLIQGKNIRPSVFRKVATTQPKPSNFVIKNLSIQDVYGNLSDPLSFKGQGSFHFTNTSKKEFNFFDIPLGILKDLGLDPGLLTPVTGEVTFELSNSKWVLTDLLNTFTEARRMQFFLHPEELSYIDMEGNVHVDIKMKQDALFKIAEPFTLIVRGTLQKPRYLLK